jgi:heme-degrading monooxygenase HmoA
MTSGEYASGMWFVKPGNEDAFVERWRAWLTVSSAGIEGFGGAYLLRSDDHPNRFVSYSEWSDAGARDRWKQSSGFLDDFEECRAFCETFEGGDFTEIVHIGQTT